MIAAALRALFLWLGNRRWMARIALGTPLLRRMPLRFVAGTSLDRAVDAVRAINASGASVTLDVLGESVEDRAAARSAAARPPTSRRSSGSPPSGLTPTSASS